MSAGKTSKETPLDYQTTLKAYYLLWRVVVENPAERDDLLKGEREADESSFGGRRKGKRGRGAGCMTIVLRILERDGKMLH